MLIKGHVERGWIRPVCLLKELFLHCFYNFNKDYSLFSKLNSYILFIPQPLASIWPRGILAWQNMITCMFIRFPCHAIYVNRYSVYTSYSCAIIPNTQGETPARPSFYQLPKHCSKQSCIDNSIPLKGKALVWLFWIETMIYLQWLDNSHHPYRLSQCKFNFNEENSFNTCMSTLLKLYN